ncbi:TorF family putative porin [Thiohalorhabdus methylotrophus]|uniref:TorF family putative porin n=1 Tax=Thiohalorhabdus methylotrophus TaxID=3242694 RepID=A0ABV4TYI5_9GAMM
MKKIVTASVCTGLLAMSGAATAGMSSTVTFATDYMFRGGSQTGNKPALQGGLTYSHASGAYVGIWASSVNFDRVASGGDGFRMREETSTEADWYVGYANSYEGLGFNIMYYSFNYPGWEDLGFDEVWGNVNYTFGPVNAKAAVRQSTNDFFGFPSYGEATAYEGILSGDLGAGFSASATYGVQEFDGSVEDYNYYDVGVSKDFIGLTWDVRYHDTDISDDDAAPAYQEKNADGRFVFSVTRSSNWDVPF